MNKLCIDETYNGIHINVQLDYKLNFLIGDSGTGKTLLMSAVDLHCLNNNISCRLCNYNDANLTESQLLNICNNSDVVLLDNADLYLTNNLLENILQSASIVVVSMKDTSSLDCGDSKQYFIEYEHLELSMREI